MEPEGDTIVRSLGETKARRTTFTLVVFRPGLGLSFLAQRIQQFVKALSRTLVGRTSQNLPH